MNGLGSKYSRPITGFLKRIDIEISSNTIDSNWPLTSLRTTGRRCTLSSPLLLSWLCQIELGWNSRHAIYGPIYDIIHTIPHASIINIHVSFFADGASDTSPTVSLIRIRKSEYFYINNWNTFGVENRSMFYRRARWRSRYRIDSGQTTLGPVLAPPVLNFENYFEFVRLDQVFVGREWERAFAFRVECCLFCPLSPISARSVANRSVSCVCRIANFHHYADRGSNCNGNPAGLAFCRAQSDRTICAQWH